MVIVTTAPVATTFAITMTAVMTALRNVLKTAKANDLAMTNCDCA